MKNSPKPIKQARKKPAKVQSTKQRFPAGWDEKKVQRVIAHYDNQTDEERAAEIEAAAQAADATLMSVPTQLVPAVLKLIASQQKTV
jgi:predicted dinucleotide-binding enzyme